MKLQIILFFAVFCVFSTWGQNTTDKTEAEPKTIFKNKPINSLGMYATGGIIVSEFYNRSAISSNIAFGIVLNRRVRIGLDVDILTSNVDVAANALVLPYSRMRWRHGNFGLNVDYTFFPNKPISINPGLAVGMGTVGKHPLDGINNNSPDQQLDNSNMFAMRPNLSINFNLLKFLSLKLGGGYRFVTGSKSQGINDAQISSPYGFVALRFEVSDLPH